MENKMNCVFLTSTSLRHKYVAHCISKRFNLDLIVTEEKSKKIKETKGLSDKNKKLITNHFEERDKSEKEYFGDYNNFPGNSTHLEVEYGKVNSQEMLQRLLAVNPSVIFLFGTSIIKPFMLKPFENRIVNLHLGLSPYYKGSGTNLWPLYFNEPECVGATIHLAEEKVDAGAVLHQLRPRLKNNDTIHDIGNKTIRKAGKVYPEVVDKYIEGIIKPEMQDLSQGKTYKIKDFTPEILRKTKIQIENGMIEDYLSDKKFRDQTKEIIESI